MGVLLLLKLVNKIRSLKYIQFIILIAFPLISLSACKDVKVRVLYINSYHVGYKPSDEILKGITNNLPSSNYELKVVYIDSKRQTSDKYLSERIDSIRKIITVFNPQLLIASDDYAVKYLIKPYYDRSDIPVVFCGVNWSADQYSLNRSHITGMVEVLPLKESIKFLKTYYPTAKTIAVISENSLSEQRNRILLDTLYYNLGLVPSYFFANDIDEWKKMLVKANQEADIIYFPTNGAIKNWNDNEAVIFIEQTLRKPVFTCDDFMMDFCVLGFTKVPIEQGEWAAATAKLIINGTSPMEIPISHNTKSARWLNEKMAHLIDFSPDTAWLTSARIINQTLPEIVKH